MKNVFRILQMKMMMYFIKIMRSKKNYNICINHIILIGNQFLLENCNFYLLLKIILRFDIFFIFFSGVSSYDNNSSSYERIVLNSEFYRRLI